MPIALRVLEHALSNDTVFEAYEGDELFDDAHCALMFRQNCSAKFFNPKRKNFCER